MNKTQKILDMQQIEQAKKRRHEINNELQSLFVALTKLGQDQGELIEPEHVTRALDAAYRIKGINNEKGGE